MATGKYQTHIPGLCALCPSCNEFHKATGVRHAKDGHHLRYEMDDHNLAGSDQLCPGSGREAEEVAADAGLQHYMSTLPST